MDRKGHGRKQSRPNQILSCHLPGRCDKTTSHLRIGSVPIKVLAGHFPNTSQCHINLLGLYKLLLTILNMTTSEWCRCFTILIKKVKDDFSMALGVATINAQPACPVGIIYTKHTSLMTMALFLLAQQSTLNHFVQASHVRGWNK